MSYILMVQNEIDHVELVRKLRSATLVDKWNMLINLKPVPFKTYYTFSDRELEEHLTNLKSELTRLVNEVNINEVYGI